MTLTVKGSHDHYYEITMKGDEPVWCSCPGYRFAKGPTEKRACKHVNRLLVGLGKPERTRKAA